MSADMSTLAGKTDSVSYFLSVLSVYAQALLPKALATRYEQTR